MYFCFQLRYFHEIFYIDVFLTEGQSLMKINCIGTVFRLFFEKNPLRRENLQFSRILDKNRTVVVLRRT